MAIGEVRVLGRAGDLPGPPDFVEDAEHDDGGARIALAAKPPYGLDLDLKHLALFMNWTSYHGRPFANHIIFTPPYRRLVWHTRTGGNMMSVAYDFAHSPA